MKRKLPLVATSIAIFKITGDHLSYAVRIIWAWYVILLLVSVAILFLTGEGGNSLNANALLLSSLVSWVAWGVIAVLWHRHLLLGEEIADIKIWIDRRMWRYILRSFAIGLIVAIPMIGSLVALLLFIDDISMHVVFLMVVVMMISVIILLRLSIALPAVALDESKIGFLDAWRATDGNSIRLFIISCISIIPFATAAELLSQTMEPSGSIGFSVRLVLLESLRLAIEFSLLLISVTFLSLSYAFLVKNQAAGKTMTTNKPQP